MKYLIPLLIASIFTPVRVCLAQYGTTQGLILLTGEVKSEDGITPLPDIHVLNQNNTAVTVTDATGFFSMYVSKIHVLRFSSVGYEPFYFSLPGDFAGEVYFVTIELKQSITPLKAITIYGETEKTESMLLRDTGPNPLANMQLGTLRGEARAIEPTIANPVSLLWDWFSKEGKEKRKLKELLALEEVKYSVDKRFESELIWELTGLYGEELENFKRYCNLPEGFVIRASEYDFLLEVKSCYYKYKSQVPRK